MRELRAPTTVSADSEVAGPSGARPAAWRWSRPPVAGHGRGGVEAAPERVTVGDVKPVTLGPWPVYVGDVTTVTLGLGPVRRVRDSSESPTSRGDVGGGEALR